MGALYQDRSMNSGNHPMRFQVRFHLIFWEFIMNCSFSFLRGKVARIGAAISSVALAPAAFAQAADPFDTALTTVTAKVTSYAGALVGLAAVAVVFMVAVKYVKKLPRAS